MPKVLQVQGAAGGARTGTCGAAGDPGASLRVSRMRQEVLEVGGPLGAQEDPRGKEVAEVSGARQIKHYFVAEKPQRSIFESAFSVKLFYATFSCTFMSGKRKTFSNNYRTPFLFCCLFQIQGRRRKSK